MMEQRQNSLSQVWDRLPPLSANRRPWLVAQNLEDSEDDTEYQIFFTIHDPLSHYRCRIPELLGNRIRGCFHGWVVLSNHPMWSVWNPLTSKIIRLPPLKLKDGDYAESIEQCCLSSPPDDPNSILLLTRTGKPTLVFCLLLDRKNKNKLNWTEMSYSKQLKKITGDDGGLVHSLSFCNGKVYALNTDGCYADFVINIDIMVKDRGEVVIKLLLFGECPFPSYHPRMDFSYFLKGSCTELFCAIVGYNDETVGAVYLFKLDTSDIKWEELEGFKDLDMTSRKWEELEGEERFKYLNLTGVMWEEIQDINEGMFFVDLAQDYSVYYSPTTASKLRGYVHIGGETGKIMHSYHVKDKTASLSSMPCFVPTSHVSVWECRSEGDHGDKQEEDDENENEIVVTSSIRHDEVECNGMADESSMLINLPLHVLDMITELCVGVEYMNFRATCKYCHLAAPLIQWSNDTALKRLKTYSLVSPWLVVVDKNRGIITFTDPMFGDKYYMKNSQVLTVDERISCSRFGWLLFLSTTFSRLVFFNPFTREIRQLPVAGCYLRSLSFSAPPTSPDCTVVGFTTVGEWHVYIHFVAREPFMWQRKIRLDFGGADPYFFCFPTFCGRDIYALCKEGELYVFKGLDTENYSFEQVVAKAPTSCCIKRSQAQYFLTKCDQNLLLVVVGGEIGEYVEVFKLNDSTKDWEKIDGLGKHMIYICGSTCLCIEAKRQEMENKIYFKRLHSENEKIVFYSLETCTYHTFDGKKMGLSFGNFLGTKHYTTNPHAWIEPSWS